jgi:hypothetical protein
MMSSREEILIEIMEKIEEEHPQYHFKKQIFFGKIMQITLNHECDSIIQINEDEMIIKNLLEGYLKKWGTPAELMEGEIILEIIFNTAKKILEKHPEYRLLMISGTFQIKKESLIEKNISTYLTELTFKKIWDKMQDKSFYMHLFFSLFTGMYLIYDIIQMINKFNIVECIITASIFLGFFTNAFFAFNKMMKVYKNSTYLRKKYKQFL